MHKFAIVAASAVFCLAACATVHAPPAAQAPTHAIPPRPELLDAPEIQALKQGVDTPLLNWNWGNPQPSGAAFSAIASGQVGGVTRLVAVGGDGLLATSDDGGMHWSPQASGLPVGVSLRDVAWGPSLGFVATGYGFHYTPTGVNPTGFFHITSSDGIHWSPLPPPGQGLPSATRIAYGNGIYVLVLTQALVLGGPQSGTVSSISCKPSAPDCNDVFMWVVYGNGEFVALGQDYGTGAMIMSASSDGVHWAAANISLPAAGAGYLYGLAWNGQVFSAVGDEGTATPLVYTSKDGVNWTAQPGPAGAEAFARDIAVGNTFYTFSMPNEGSAQVYTSTDGVTWSAGATTQGVLPGNGSHSILYLPNTGFIATSSGVPMSFSTSPDFASWSSVSLGTGPTQRVESLVYANGRFIAMGPGQLLLDSGDEGHWTQVSIGDATYKDMCWDGSSYIAVGSGTYAFDGSHSKPLDGPQDGTGVACRSKLVVQVGLGGLISTSSDGGSQWQTQASGTSDNLAGVATDGKLFVAAAGVESQTDGTTLLTSPDGITWTKVPGLSSTGQALMFGHVRWVDGDFMAAGGEYVVDGTGKRTGNGCTSQVLAVSSDGISWTVHRYPDAGCGLGWGDVASAGGAVYLTRPYSTGLGLAASLDRGARMGQMVSMMPSIPFKTLVAGGGKLVGTDRDGAIVWAYDGQPVAIPTKMIIPGGNLQGIQGSPGAGYAGDGLIFSIKDPPAHGTAGIINLSGNNTIALAVYYPNAGYIGQDSFTFQVQDYNLSQLFSRPATVTVTVAGAKKQAKKAAAHP